MGEDAGDLGFCWVEVSHFEVERRTAMEGEKEGNVGRGRGISAFMGCSFSDFRLWRG